MFAVKCPITYRPNPMRRRISKVTKAYYTLDNRNSKPLDDVSGIEMFHVLAFIQDGDHGIYSVSEKNDDEVIQHHVIAFRNFEDAFRYKNLLEAEIKFRPYVQFASRYELDHMCRTGGYNCRVVDEDVLVTPPTNTVTITDWERRSALLEGRWTVKEKDDTQ